MNNEQIIAQAVTSQGVPDVIAEFIVEQAKVESNNFQSHVFVTDNNAFGMKVPSIRKSPYIAGPSTIVMTAEGTQPYAHYNSLEDSAKDLVNWLKYNNVDWSEINSREDYTAFLKSKGYYGISQDSYTSAMMHYYNEAKTAIGNAYHRNQGAVVATGATIVLMLVYSVYRIVKARK